MASKFATLFSIFTIALLSISCSSQSPNKPFNLPIGKDPLTNLFYTSVSIGTPQHNFNLVIDLGGPILWYDCNKNYNSSTYNPLPCESKLCSGEGGCTSCNGHFKPGCTNNTCGATIINPLATTLFSGDTGEDILVISHSTISGLIFGCTDSGGFSDTTPLDNLPKTSKGIIGLGRTKLSLPIQLSSLSSHKLPQKFALCLPSSNKKGLGSLFLGGVPQQKISSSKFNLTTIPLIINPFSTAPIFTQGDASYEYFIDVKSIKVGGEVLNFKSSLLKIDNKGNGGTKISTINSFTKLHSSIYNPLVRDFVKKTNDKKIKKVASVAPFEACFDLSTIGRTITGLDVPTIDLVFEGVKWTIYGGNSMVLVNKKVACLGFVDGGKEPMTSIVIGGHILEDILLEFDSTTSKLGFSSSLRLHNERCSYT